MSQDDFDKWLTTEPDDVLDKYPTHCDRHNEHRPCPHCRDEAADRKWQEYLEERK